MDQYLPEDSPLWTCICDSHSGFRSGHNSLVYSVSQQIIIAYLLCMRPCVTHWRDWMSLQIQWLPSILFTLGRKIINKWNINKKGKIKMNCDHYCLGNKQDNVIRIGMGETRRLIWIRWPRQVELRRQHLICCLRMGSSRAFKELEKGKASSKGRTV